MIKKTFSPLLLALLLLVGLGAEAATLDFGKEIDFDILRPMFAMTIPEKIRYVQSFGVDVYKVADPEKAPATLGHLPEANSEQFGKYLRLFAERTLGLYMTPNNNTYKVKKPTILLVESADDWTIVHEFSHYLFDRARMSGPYANESHLVNNSADAQEDYFNARNKYKIWDGYVDEDHKKKTIHSFINYAKVQMVFATTCELEETTIEKMLRGVYTSASPQGFNDKHFERSTRYIRNTSRKGQENLGFLMEDCKVLSKTLNAQDKVLKASLATVCKRAQKLAIEDLYLLNELQIRLDAHEEP